MTKNSNQFRTEVDELARDTGWTLRRFSLLFVGTALFLMVVGFSLNSLGMIGRTAVEREVFEQSYQRSAAQEARFNTLTAEMAGVQARLDAGNLTAVQQSDLAAQAAMLRIQLQQMED